MTQGKAYEKEIWIPTGTSTRPASLKYPSSSSALPASPFLPFFSISLFFRPSTPTMLALRSLFTSLLLVAAALPAFVAAVPHAHDHVHKQRALGSKWYHEARHPAHDLFKRTHVHQKRQATSTTPSATPSVGSDSQSKFTPAFIMKQNI